MSNRRTAFALFGLFGEIVIYLFGSILPCTVLSRRPVKPVIPRSTSIDHTRFQLKPEKPGSRADIGRLAKVAIGFPRVLAAEAYIQIACGARAAENGSRSSCRTV